jgi:hypothetical protein
MIIFFGQGRLGNQIFQYAFIKNFLKEEEKLLVINFKEFLKLFNTKDDIVNIENRYLQHLLRLIGDPILRILSHTRIISSYRAKRSELNEILVENGEYKYRKGLFPIKYVFPGHFQSEKYFNKENIEDIYIKEEYLEKAQEFLSKIPKESEKIFVHLRRGDYKTHHCLGKEDITLPLGYYKRQIERLNKQYTNPTFIFLSDDTDYVKDNLKDIRNKIISDQNMYVDFCILTLCDGGIMSNSTFAWWGGFLMKKGPLIAPKYWFGFKSKVEFPRGISPSFAEIVNFTDKQK